jgi:hypothetical protein
VRLQAACRQAFRQLQRSDTAPDHNRAATAPCLLKDAARVVKRVQGHNTIEFDPFEFRSNGLGSNGEQQLMVAFLAAIVDDNLSLIRDKLDHPLMTYIYIQCIELVGCAWEKLFFRDRSGQEVS